jgi:hypothetical protein
MLTLFRRWVAINLRTNHGLSGIALLQMAGHYHQLRLPLLSSSIAASLTRVQSSDICRLKTAKQNHQIEKFGYPIKLRGFYKTDWKNLRAFIFFQKATRILPRQPIN